MERLHLVYMLEITAIMVLVYGVKHKMYKYNPTGFTFAVIYASLGFIYHLVDIQLFHYIFFALQMSALLFIVGLSVFYKYQRAGKKRRSTDV